MAQRTVLEITRQVLTECPDGLAAELLGHHAETITTMRQLHKTPNHWHGMTPTRIRIVTAALRPRWIGGVDNPPLPISPEGLANLVAAEMAKPPKPHHPQKPAAKRFLAEVPLDPERVFTVLKLYAQDRGHDPTITELARFGRWSVKQTEGAINRLRKADRVRRDHENETFYPYREPRKHVGYGREKNITGFIPKEEIMNA